MLGTSEARLSEIGDTESVQENIEEEEKRPRSKSPVRIDESTKREFKEAMKGNYKKLHREIF